MNKTSRKFRKIKRTTEDLKQQVSDALDKVDENEIEAAHLYVLVVEHLYVIANHLEKIVRPSLHHVDNNHKPMLAIQNEELLVLKDSLIRRFDAITECFNDVNPDQVAEILVKLEDFVKQTRVYRKNQIKRLKKQETGTRSSVLFLNHVTEILNMALFSNRMLRVFDELIIHPEEEFLAEGDNPVVTQDGDGENDISLEDQEDTGSTTKTVSDELETDGDPH